MKKKIGIIIGVVVIIAVLFGVNIWKSVGATNTAVEVTSLSKEKISEKVMTPGILKLANEQTIYHSLEKGEIAEFYVEEGADVKKGDALLRYENKQLKLEVKQNELQLQSTQLQLNNIRKQHKDLDEQLKKDKENDMLQDEHDQLELQEKQTKLEIEQLQLQQQGVEGQISDLVVRSEMDGKVVSVNKGATASTSGIEPQALIQIGTLNQLIVEGVISEYDTLKIEEDQNVVLSSDAKPGESWKGKVSFIAFLPKEADALQGETGVQYPIEVTVDDENMNLKPGFQMVIEIITEERETKTLPLTAVKQEGETNYVYIVVDGKAKKQDVEVGLVSNENIEIIKGLTEKEKVILDPSDNVTAGMDVTVE
jgi:HlyD family secretion protein